MMAGVLTTSRAGGGVLRTVVCARGAGADVDRLTTQCLRGDFAFWGLPQGLTKVDRRVDTERWLAAAMYVARVVSGVAKRCRNPLISNRRKPSKQRKDEQNR